MTAMTRTVLFEMSRIINCQNYFVAVWTTQRREHFWLSEAWYHSVFVCFCVKIVAYYFCKTFKTIFFNHWSVDLKTKLKNVLSPSQSKDQSVEILKWQVFTFWWKRINF